MGDYGDAMMRDQNAAVQGRTKAQNRANVLQLKLIGQSHPTGLTNNLLKLFEPRQPLVYKPPPEKRKCPPYTGVAQLVSEFANPGDPEYATPVQKGETPAQRRARIHAIRLEEGAKRAADEFERYDPNNDPNISGDPYKTLFVARLNYETSESRLKREFEAYGPIKRISLITDKETNKPRGYAFIEYTHTRDMKAAYKQADGKKLDNRRVFVDVERGRTVPNWRPRRLGGGLGTTRVGSGELSQKYPGREQLQSGGISVSEEPRVRDEGDRNLGIGGERRRESGKGRVSYQMIDQRTVTIEMIGIIGIVTEIETETGKGTGIETMVETGRGIEPVIVVENVRRNETVIGNVAMTAIVIGKGKGTETGIMKSGMTTTEDVFTTMTMNMIVVILNMKEIVVLEIEIMVVQKLKIIVGGLVSLNMDMGIQKLSTIVDTTMSTMVEDSMTIKMASVIMTDIGKLTVMMIRWMMMIMDTTEQHLTLKEGII